MLRRNLIKGIGALIFAPAIIRVADLMPIKVERPKLERFLWIDTDAVTLTLPEVAPDQLLGFVIRNIGDGTVIVDLGQQKAIHEFVGKGNLNMPAGSMVSFTRREVSNG